MRKHRSYPIEFKRQVAQEYLAGETLHGLAKRHDINRNLVRIWVAKYEAGSFDNDVIAADLVQTRRGNGFPFSGLDHHARTLTKMVTAERGA